jgi:hypothetical protein
MKKFLPILLVLVVISVLIIGLQTLNANRNRELTGADRAAVVAYAAPITENLLAGFRNADFATFSRDFGEKMRKQFTSQSFADLRQSLSSRGPYQSYQVVKSEFLNGYVIVTCNLQFEKGTAGMKLILSPKKTHTVEGLSIKQ